MPIHSTDTLAASALAYVRAGWPVYPLAPRSKVPIAGSHGYHDATRDPERVRAWWARDPHRNIGAALVPGTIRLDIDGALGHETLARIESLGSLLPETQTLDTGRDDGEHRIYTVPKGLRFRARLGPGLEIKSHDAILPPSVHANGRIYAWRDPGARPAPLPAWVLRLVTQTRRWRRVKPKGPFARAVALWDADHPGDWPRSGGRCPICGHAGCFGRGLDSSHWICWSTAHREEDGGMRKDHLVYGDALDIEAHARGATRREVLLEDGYLRIEPDGQVSFLAAVGNQPEPESRIVSTPAAPAVTGMARDLFDALRELGGAA